MFFDEPFEEHWRQTTAQTLDVSSLLPVHQGTVNDNDLFLLYRRQLPGLGWELDMFRINEENEMSVVRRLYVGGTEPSNNLLPISDGSIFAREPDPDGDSTELFRRYAPDGTDAVVWRESETTFTTHGIDMLSIGPRL